MPSRRWHGRRYSEVFRSRAWLYWYEDLDYHREDICLLFLRIFLRKSKARRSNIHSLPSRHQPVMPSFSQFVFLLLSLFSSTDPQRFSWAISLRESSCHFSKPTSWWNQSEIASALTKVGSLCCFSNGLISFLCSLFSVLFLFSSLHSLSF